MISLRYRPFLIFLFFLPRLVFSQSVGDYRAIADGNWTTLATWEYYSGSWGAATDYPGQNVGTGNVDIQNSYDVTLNVSPANAIGSLNMTCTNTNTSLTFGGAYVLNVTGAITYTGPTSNGISNTISVASGTLTCASVSMPTLNNDAKDCYLNASSGTITVSGDLTMNSTDADRNAVVFTGAGSLQVAGSMTGGGFVSSGSETVEFTSAGASNIAGYTFYNLTISGAGTKTLTGGLTVANTLNISAGTLEVTNCNFSVGGNATIDGTFSDNNSSGANTFSRDVTINGTWLASGNDAYSIVGNLTNNGTFTSGTGKYTFTGAGKTFEGTNAITFSGGVVEVAGSYTNNTTVNITRTNAGALQGAGSWTQAASASSILNYAGSTITISGGFDVDGAGNTVNYNRSGNQTVFTPTGSTYHHLKATIGNTKTLSGDITVNGDLTIDVATLATVAFNIDVTGSTTISNAGQLRFTGLGTATLPSLTLSNGTVDGTTNGACNVTTLTVAAAGGTIDLVDLTVSGATTLNGDLTVSNTTGTKIFAGAVTLNAGTNFTSTITTVGILIFQGGITHNGNSFTAEETSFNTNSQALGGSGSLDFAGVVTVTGVTLTNNTTVNITSTAAGSLDGTGTWTQGATGTLNYAGQTMTINTLNASAAGNTVNYNRGGAQTIFAASAGSYHHLKVTVSGTKTLSNIAAAYYANGDLTIDAATLATGGVDIDDVGGTAIITNAGIFQFTAAGTAFNSTALTIANGTITQSGGYTGSVSTGTFTVNAGGATIGRCNFTVSTATNINDDVNFNNNTGTKTFIGLVTLSNAGTDWTSTSVVDPVFRGGITQNGNSFSASTATFNTNSQTINGSGSLSFSGTVTVTGVTVTNNTTVSITATAGGSLTGTGTWTQGNSSTLNYAGQTMTTITLNASATDNTVNYDRSGGVQTIYNPNTGTYYNLTISNSTTKTLSADVAVSGDLQIQNTAILDASTYNISLAGDWNNSSSSADPFTEGSQTVIFNGGGPQSIINSGDAEGTVFYNITVSNTSGDLTLSANTSVGGTLNFTSGKLFLGTNNLTITSGNAVTGYNTSRYVVTNSTGYLQINGMTTGITRVFPIGNNSASYSPATITNNSTTSPVNFNVYACRYVSTTGTCSGGTQIVENGVGITWQITPSTSPLAGAGAEIELAWNTADEMTFFTRNDCAVNHYIGGAWTASANSAATDETGTIGAGYYSQTASFTTFSPFGVGKGSSPLPIELLSFMAKPNGVTVDITWETASEINNDYFVIEKTTDNLIFEEVERVEGAGNSSIVRNYAIVDRHPSKGISYYRLKQVDYDGSYEYSELVAVNNESSSYESIKVYPNPSNGNNVTIDITNIKEKEVLVNVYNILGEIMYSKIVLVEDSPFITPNNKLDPGVYFIVGSSNNVKLDEQRLIVY